MAPIDAERFNLLIGLAYINVDQRLAVHHYYLPITVAYTEA